MALISCPECAKDVSSAAASCPHCGHPIRPSAEPDPPPVPNWSKGVAAVLSLVIPGAGQMYKGQVANGLVWLAVVAAAYFVQFVPGVMLHLLCILGAASGDPYK